MIISIMRERTKRQDLPPKNKTARVEMVGTPIGNLGDLTPRAREALASCDLVLCEDTRRTRQLLSAFEISKPLERLDENITQARMEKILSKIRDENLHAVFVTDAGTPGVSDPGAWLVAMATEQGVDVSPVPGVSAVTALLSVCGFHQTAFVFRGFFPRKNKDQISEIEQAQSCDMARVFIWFESAQRLTKTLAQIAQLCPSVRIIAAKELTKQYEKIFRGDAAEICAKVEHELAEHGEKGEWVFAVCFDEVKKPNDLNNTESDWTAILEALLIGGVSVSDAARQVSQRFGVSRKHVYAEALKIYQKKNHGGA